MVDEDGNEIVGEDESKIKLETELKWVNYNYNMQIPVATLAMVLAELYEKGIDIGWETKILDPLADALRELHNNN